MSTATTKVRTLTKCQQEAYSQYKYAKAEIGKLNQLLATLKATKGLAEAKLLLAFDTDDCCRLPGGTLVLRHTVTVPERIQHVDAYSYVQFKESKA